MAWKSPSQIKKFLQEYDKAGRLEQLFALSEFGKWAIFPLDYVASPRWVELVELTEAGKSLLARDPGIYDDVAIGDIYFAIFGLFYAQDILIDVEGSDLEGIRAVLDVEALKGRIRWPYRFGRLLYNKYNSQFPEGEIAFLISEQIAEFLNDTPQGVYQIGTLLSGPLGFLTSRENRFIPPSLEMPLWHCSDPGCSRFHTVGFLPPNIAPVVEAYARLDEGARKLGPPSPWRSQLARLGRKDKVVEADGRLYADLPAVLGGNIVGVERTKLLARVLKSEHASWLRQIIGAPPRRKQQAEGIAEDVASKLSEAEQVQLLLLLPDSDLVTQIDQAIFSREIPIPPNEVRKSDATQVVWRNDPSSEVSSLGIRAARTRPLITLFSVVWEAYQALNLVDELDWKLHKGPERSSRDALASYVEGAGPAAAVRQLIMSSKPISLRISDELGLALNEQDDPDVLADRFLWKLGFSPFRYDTEYSVLRARMNQFRETLLQIGEIKSEASREAIRSTGVNLFVSVEHFLEHLIAFNIWLLVSDHFLKTRFVYEAEAAVASVSSALEPINTTEGQSIQWNKNGGNTLGVLLAYLSQAVKWIEALPERERHPLAREEHDIPSYANSSERVFPLKHYEMWADSDSRELSLFAHGFKTVANQLSRANLASIRNGLDHHRSEDAFPTAEGMIACVTWLKDGLDYADLHRYIPKTFWLQSRSEDQFGGRQYMLQDYLDRPLALRGPSILTGVPLATFNKPLIIAPGNLLGLPNAELKFRVEDRSAFSKYWEGFPLRRQVEKKGSDPDENLDNTPLVNDAEAGDLVQPV